MNRGRLRAFDDSLTGQLMRLAIALIGSLMRIVAFCLLFKAVL